MKKVQLNKYKKQIRALVEKLPKIREIVVVSERILGGRIIKESEGEHPKDSNGNPLNPDTWYTRKIPQYRYVDHQKRLINAVKKDGEAGIAAYLLKVGEMIEKQQREEQAILNSATLDKPELSTDLHTQHLGIGQDDLSLAPL